VGLSARRPHVVVVETDPPMLCLLGAFLKFWRRCKLVVYLQDIYPDVAVVLDGLREGRFSRLLRNWFFAAYRQADRIVVLSDDMRDYLLRRGISPTRISVVPNWVDARSVQPIKTANPFRRLHGLDGKFVAMYSGNIGLSQRLENVLEAADRLRNRSDIRFLLVGEGASKRKLQDEAERRKLPNVTFLGYQPKEKLGESLSAADLHLITLHPKVLSFLMPSKLYGILASGTACVATAPESTELAEIVKDREVGLIVPPDDPVKLAEAVEWAADHPEDLAAMGDRAYRLAQAEYDRPLATGRFADLLAQVSGVRRSPDDATMDVEVRRRAEAPVTVETR
jgi:glycosyltransferase involved in cell wall biosynthesis